MLFYREGKPALRDNAKAAIILPSSILNKDGIYKSTREILFANFDFIAIVELGSQTFGATGTNTIILFLRKKENYTPENTTISQDYSNIKNYIESGNLLRNETYKNYVKAFNAYCDFRGFDKGEYESFLNGSLESQPNGWAAGFRVQNIESSQSTTQLLELDTFKEYHAAFKETSDYKKLVESKAYKDSKDKDTLIHNVFLTYAKEIEKDKLLYFSLSFNQAPIIIKAPNDNKEQKRFLGYEWSNRKGDEGLKELHSPYLSPLFERDNPHNPNKLAHLIRQAFLEISSPIPQDLSLYAFKTKLIAMLDFSKVDFNKAISLNPINSQGEFNAQNPFENCKYELVKLESVCKMYQPQTITGKEILEQGQYKVYGANGVIGFYDKYNHKDAEVVMTCRGATCGTINFTEPESWITGNAMIITPLEKNLILKKFLIYILPLSNIKSVITGAAQPQITRTNLSQLKIPLPPLEIQTQIVAECEKVEEQYNTIRMSIEKYQELIKAILVKCGIIANTDESIGGGAVETSSLPC